MPLSRKQPAITLSITMNFVSARFLVLYFTTLLLSAAEWPQWRGPERDDISREIGLLQRWPAGGPPLVWKAEKLGAGFSGVAVAGGKIFTAGDGADSSFVHALDLNGKPVWAAKLGKPGERGGFVGPRSTPTVDGSEVFMLGQHGDLVCYEAANGKQIWRKNLATDFNGRVGGWGYSESVLVDDGHVICTPGGPKGTMMALDRKTGALVWRTADWTDAAEYVSPVLATISGVKQYVQMTGKSVAGISKDGTLLWRTERKGSTAVIPTPLVKDDMVYVTSGYGIGCNLFQVIQVGGAFEARQVYANKVMANHHGGVIQLVDFAYGYSDGKGWTCQNLKTGEPAWTSNKLGKGSLTCADGHFYLRKEDGKGTIVLIEATPTGYRETGRFDQPERSGQNSWPHPVIAAGKLYIRDQQLLLCYDITAK